MRNITIAIEDDLPRESREYARQHRTTLNGLIRTQLRDSVSKRSSAWVEEMFRHMDRTRASSRGKRWEREDLHDV
jgi:hypothetical protein